MRVSDYRNLKFVYLISGIEFALLLICFGVITCPDSDSYIDAWERISNNIIDHYRTPVYPIIIGLCRLLSFGKATLFLVVIVQILTFFVSIKVLNTVLTDIVGESHISYWITFFYAVSPSFTSYHITILTESFALSGSVFLLSSLFCCLNKFSIKHVLKSSFWLLFLVFLRPSFIYLIPILLIIWLWSFFRHRNFCAILVGVLCIFMVSGLMHLYMSEFKEKYGIYSTSSIGIVNQYYLARQYNYLDPSKFTDLNEREKVEKFIEVNDESELSSESFEICDIENDLAMIQDALTASVKSHPIEFIKGYFVRLYWALRHPVFKSTIDVFKYIMDIIGFSLNSVMLMFIFHIFIIFYSFKLYHQLPLKTLLLLMLSIANLFTITFGAYSEWSRLFLPSLPCVLIMFGQYLKMFRYKEFLELS